MTAPVSRPALTTLTLVSALAGCGFMESVPGSGSNEPPVEVLGRRLPDFVLQSAAGPEFRLSHHLTEGPLVLMLVGVEDCLSCGDYVKELRIIKREVPSLRGFVVGVGRDTAFFAAYFRQQRFTAHGLFDTDSLLPTALGRRRTPVTIVLDTTRTVIFVDTRLAAEASALPISRLLSGLGSSLSRGPRCSGSDSLSAGVAATPGT